MNKIGGAIISIALCILIFAGVLVNVFTGGVISLWFKEYFGTRNADVDNKIFKQSTTYNEGMIDDLAEYKYELKTEKDPVSKAAIEDVVVERFANFDASKIRDSKLKDFLNDCRNGDYEK